MKVAILGTGLVGIALAKGFAQKGDQVTFGTRDPHAENAQKAVAAVAGSAAKRYADAAREADIAVLVTPWSGTQNAVELAGADNLAGKLVIDVTNPLDFSSGNPTLALGFPNSAGAQIQAWLPKSHVVKAFNIITATHMVNPKLPDGQPDMLIAGNDTQAKQQVAQILKQFGWRSAIDMGAIEKSYLLEALAMIWVDYGFTNNHWTHGFSLLSAKA